ncbi:MAG TPA: hypothetical protein P5567_00505 [Kiritimatiellia bacterium]|nr:hypothetical protein [Kiritimatiellia bacterium]HRZ10915.1 hypothetical protein [Kiritimatiellia bacterium]HSA18812.1 hypothetical protein [Kiritimatiellia bacterium]
MNRLTELCRLVALAAAISGLVSCGKKAEPPPPAQTEEAVAPTPEVEDGPVRTAFRGETPLLDIAVVPPASTNEEPLTLVAAGESRTVLRSTDNGETWAPVLPAEKDGPDFSAVLFPTTADGWLLFREQVLHSSDRGATWTAAAVPERGFYYFGSLSAVGSQCYAIQPPTCGAKVFRTGDGGATWTALEGGLPRNDYGAVFFRDDRRGWVVGPYGRYAFTEDGGATWKTKDFPSEIGWAELEMVTDDFGWMRADRGHAGRLWITRDGGSDWETVDLSIQGYWNIVDVDFLDPDTGLALAQKGADGSLVLLSRDAGATWAVWMDVKPVLTAMAFRDLDHGWFTSADGRIYKTVPAP